MYEVEEDESDELDESDESDELEDELEFELEEEDIDGSNDSESDALSDSFLGDDLLPGDEVSPDRWEFFLAMDLVVEQLLLLSLNVDIQGFGEK